MGGLKCDKEKIKSIINKLMIFLYKNSGIITHNFILLKNMKISLNNKYNIWLKRATCYNSMNSKIYQNFFP